MEIMLIIMMYLAVFLGGVAVGSTLMLSRNKKETQDFDTPKRWEWLTSEGRPKCFGIECRDVVSRRKNECTLCPYWETCLDNHLQRYANYGSGKKEKTNK
jgi:hypothetical protein